MAAMGSPLVPSTAGTSVLDLLKSYEEIVGPDVLAAAREKLPAEIRAELDAMTSLSWMPVTSVARVVDQIAAEAKADPEALLDRAVRLATKRTLTTVWRALLKLTTDAALIARTPIFYSKSRNVGRLHARLVARRRAELTLTEWPSISQRHRRTLAISIETIVTLAGRRDVEVSWEPTADGAVYRLTWSA